MICFFILVCAAFLLACQRQVGLIVKKNSRMDAKKWLSTKSFTWKIQV